MPTIKISTKNLSEAFWTYVYDQYKGISAGDAAAFRKEISELETLRKEADFNTGSISTATACGLYGLTKWLAPKSLIEIGTFIGRSTIALARGMTAARPQAILYTCDADNRIELPKVEGCVIRQFPKTSSTDMFRTLLRENLTGCIDMAYIDGRLRDGDELLLKKLCRSDVVIVFDDFREVEKGTANAVTLAEAKIPPRARLILPPTDGFLRRYGLYGPVTTGLLVPALSLNLE
jgi:predicted O-methyltransferase YrrM